MYGFILYTALLFGTPDSVFICNGSLAAAYHKTKNCKGLEKCTKAVSKIPKTNAVNKLKRKPCGYCYKK